MYNEAIISADDFIENTAPRLPICFCLDFSYSMSEAISHEGDIKISNEIEIRDGKRYRKVYGEKITKKVDALKDAFQSFLDSIKNDEQARLSAEISVISFNDKTRFLAENSNVTEIENIEFPKPDGGTHLYEALLYALDLLEERKEKYKSEGAQYYQPWLVLITDGQPEGDTLENKKAAQTQLEKLCEKRKLQLYPVCIEKESEEDGSKALADLVPGVIAFKLDSCDIGRFFEFLSQSAIAQSSSACVEESTEESMVMGITKEEVMREKFNGTGYIKKADNKIEKTDLRSLFLEADSWSKSVDY